MTNRLGDGDVAVSPPAPRQPGRLVRLGADAFAAARERDVPILLSVGYSACHWCHVMAHESFEDDGVAAAMNAAFVNVKVDREERPDVDAIYMDAVQAMTGRGGWPMTVFITPERRAVLRRHVLPEADVPPVDRRGQRCVGNPARRARQEHRAAARVDLADHAR